MLIILLFSLFKSIKKSLRLLTGLIVVTVNILYSFKRIMRQLHPN